MRKPLGVLTFTCPGGTDMSLYVDIKKNLGSFVLETKFEADGGVTGILGASG